MSDVIIGENLTIEKVIQVCRYNLNVKLSDEAKNKISECRKYIDNNCENDKLLYGINTGVGNLCNVKIEKNERNKLQKNLILSHAVGTGEKFSDEIIKATLLILVNSLSKGYSGVRLQIVETLIKMINLNIIPVVPQKGSLGASGDLVPLAHMILPLIGYGKVSYKGKIYSSKYVMKKNKIQLIELQEKEGLSLINGTHIMTAIGVFLVYDSCKLSKVADISSALSFEALHGIADNLDLNVHKLRPQIGQYETAQNLLRLLKNSKNTIYPSQNKVQDAYSIRCIPQVHGATKDAINYVKNIVNIELNPITDNPIIFLKENKVISTGNFHGQPLAIAYDFLAIALSELCNISERRIERLVNSKLSGLPSFLINNGGTNSGFMITQYVAAALVSENKVLSHPASVDSIPSSENQEDHVSMGTISARKCLEIINNLSRILSIELLCASQAIDMVANDKLGNGTYEAYSVIRENVSYCENDRLLYGDINKIETFVENGELVNRVEKCIGKLHF